MAFRILLIGAGAAGAVVAKKMAQNTQFCSHLHIASRTHSKCVSIKEEIAQFSSLSVTTQSLDADNIADTVQCIESFQPDLVMNLALPYQDLNIMEACLATRVHYLDTANYEPKDKAEYAYHWQWAYQERFKEAGIMALLGCGFDPGVTNVFCAYAAQELLDEITHIDIFDCNDGDHHQAFATNFNPEINIREITQVGKYYEKGDWHITKPLSVQKMIDFPGVGPRKATLINHEEMESLVKHFPKLERIRFWMTFSDTYLNHLEVCQNLGLTGIEPVVHQGQEIVPIEFLKTLLPEPASLAKNYDGKTSIGCQISGVKDAEAKTYTLFNNCEHQSAYQDVGAQAVSYTTGVPAVVAAKMMLQGIWMQKGVWHCEQLPAKPFLTCLAEQGLSFEIQEGAVL